MPNYANGSIYKIWSISTDEIYIGSTVEPLSKRMTKHRCGYKRYKAGKYHYITSFKIMEYGDAKIELIEKIDCKCREELLSREGYYIRTLECVNKCIAGRTKKQWDIDNKDKMKQYREDNKDKLTEYSKQHYKKNKDKISQRHKQYREDNKDKMKQYQQDNKEKLTEYYKQRYKKNKDKIKAQYSEKIKCECSAIVCRSSLSRHKKTKKHLLFVNTRN